MAPLTGEGRLDLDEWRRHRGACTVHRFWPGEYVSITEHDGIQRTFRVVSVRPVEA